MPVDGSQYFSSQKSSCPSCLTKTSKKRVIRYSHQILQAVIVHPDNKPVIPLAPEAIQNTDGTEKQDCEINAGKRFIKKFRKTHLYPDSSNQNTEDGRQKPAASHL